MSTATVEAMKASLALIGDFGMPEALYDHTTEDHLRSMLTRMEAGMEDGKANRWLGYAQGVLVALGVATVEELKVINAGLSDGRPMSADEAISFAVEKLNDGYDQRQFLLSWANGDWEIVNEFTADAA